MGARHAEFAFGVWLLVSPFVFGHVGDGRLLAVDLLAGLLLLVVPLLCYRERLRRAHLFLLLVAAGLSGSGWWALASRQHAPPGHQNHVVVGLLLAMTAIVPSRAAEPPPGWRRRERPAGGGRRAARGFHNGAPPDPRPLPPAGKSRAVDPSRELGMGLAPTRAAEPRALRRPSPDREVRPMQVRDVMTRQVECVLSTGTLADAARKMKELDVGSIPVIDKGETVGLVTDRDIAVRAIAEGRDPNETPVSDVMTRDVIWVDADDDVARAAELMRERKVRRLLVRGPDRQLAGVLSLGDLSERDERAAGRVLHTLFDAP